MDNVSSHGGSDALASLNITVKFPPPNTTSRGITQAFKMRYHQKLMEYILAHVETCMSGTTLAKQITVLNAVKWYCKVWEEISESTIKKCFQNGGFKWGVAWGSDARDEDHEATQTESCGELLAAAEASGVSVYMTLKQFVVIDGNIATESKDDWEEHLVRSYIERMKNSNDDDDEVIIIPEPVLTIREAYSIASKLQNLVRRWLGTNSWSLVSKIEKKLVEEKLRGLWQKLLEDIWQPVSD